MEQATTPEKEQEEVLEASFEEGVTDNQRLSTSTIKSVLSKTGFSMGNLCSVYYLEYVITTGWTVATTNQILSKYPGRIDNFQYTNSYVIFNFCY
jgi:transcriptional/translational regulatory protein YebC/TACO1